MSIVLSLKKFLLKFVHDNKYKDRYKSISKNMNEKKNSQILDELNLVVIKIRTKTLRTVFKLMSNLWMRPRVVLKA